MRAIIHIGTEKTGSTTIQDFVTLNRAPLREQGVAILDTAGHLNNSKIVVYAMDSGKVDDLVKKEGIEGIEDRNRWRDNFQEELHQELSSLEGKVDSVLISSEHLHSRLVSKEEVERVHSLLSPFCSDFRIVVYLRRQDRLALSLFSTYFKSGGTDSLPDRLAKQAEYSPEYYDFGLLLNKWSEVFGAEAIVPRVFSRDSFLNGNLLEDFFFACELSRTGVDFSNIERRNISLSKEALEVLSIFNRYFPADGNEPDAKNNFNLRGKLVDSLEKDLPGVPLIVDRETAAGFVNNFSTSNQEIAKKWFNRDQLFDDDFSIYEEKRENIDSTVVLDTVLRFFKDNDLLHLPGLEKPNIGDNRGKLLCDLALKFEKENPYVACFLMEEASRYLPDDPTICGKLADYKAIGLSD